MAAAAGPAAAGRWLAPDLPGHGGSRPPAWLASRDEAAARYLRTPGPAGQPAAAGPAVNAGPQKHHGRWRLAMDPGAFAVGAPGMPRLPARCQAPVTLARGEHDAMNTDTQLARLGAPW